MTTVVFTRGGLAESVHQVAWCATGPDGEVNHPFLKAFGQPDAG